MGLVARKPVVGVSDKQVSNQSPQLQRQARNCNFTCSKFTMILSKMRITKALIRLRGCAGWSTPVLFENPEDRFSRVEAHIHMELICFLTSQSTINYVGMGLPGLNQY